jgi:hypothetical protein
MQTTTDGKARVVELLVGTEQMNEELYDEVCRLRCVAQQRGSEVMYLTAADELVKLRNEVTRLNTANNTIDGNP